MRVSAAPSGAPACLEAAQGDRATPGCSPPSSVNPQTNVMWNERKAATQEEVGTKVGEETRGQLGKRTQTERQKQGKEEKGGKGRGSKQRAREGRNFSSSQECVRLHQRAPISSLWNLLSVSIIFCLFLNVSP